MNFPGQGIPKEAHHSVKCGDADGLGLLQVDVMCTHDSGSLVTHSI